MKSCANYKLHEANGTPSMPQGLKGLAEKLMKTNIINITAQIDSSRIGTHLVLNIAILIFVALTQKS